MFIIQANYKNSHGFSHIIECVFETRAQAQRWIDSVADTDGRIYRYDIVRWPTGAEIFDV